MRRHCRSTSSADYGHHRKLSIHETQRRVGAFSRHSAERLGRNADRRSVQGYEQARRPALFADWTSLISATMMTTTRLIHGDSRCLFVAPATNHILTNLALSNSWLYTCCTYSTVWRYKLLDMVELVQFSLEELLHKVCARTLVMSGIDVISWPLTERWWIPDDGFFPDILPIIFQTF